MTRSMRDGTTSPDGSTDEEAEAAAEELIRSALDDEVRRRLQLFVSGIEMYRAHSYKREMTEPALCWKEGTTRLLDYAPGSDGKPLLIVPSLVNRAYVLDLNERRSFVRKLAAQGYRPFLVDWDAPGSAERHFTLTDYIAGRLEGALEAVLQITGQRPGLIGYCMGGLMTLALSQRRASDCGPLILLATPWDFSADLPPMAGALGAVEPWLGATIDSFGQMPTDMIQSLFFMLDPFSVIAKYMAFSELEAESDQAQEFVALEDWLNDGVPLAAPVAREALFGWYGRNTPSTGDWRVAGRTVDPAKVLSPSLAVVPVRDRIVPPASARALADALPAATRIDVTLGHIGMVASEAAPERAWAAIIGWLNENWEERSR